MNYKLTKEQFLKLYDGDISKREYDAIIDQITNRINYIIRDVMALKVHWWDYSNGYGERDGYFDPNSFDVDGYVTLDGEYTIPKPYEYTDFPTRWLWEDFEEEFKQTVQKYEESFQESVRKYREERDNKREKDEEKREAFKRKKEEMEKIISSKLTEEELKFIQFK